MLPPVSSASSTVSSSVSTTRVTVAPPPPPPPSPPPTVSVDTVDAPKPSPPVNLSGAPSWLPLPPVGPRLDHIDDGWTPQGQGYDEGRGEILTTYYQDAKTIPFGPTLAPAKVLLSVQDKDHGGERLQVELGGTPPPAHGGGVSTDGDRVYVSDTDRVYVYSRAELESAAAKGVSAKPLQQLDLDTDDVTDPATGLTLRSAGSFMAVKDGYAYVGGYSEDGDGRAGALWRYPLNGDGTLSKTPEGPLRVPDRAQGVAVVDGALLFTTGARQLVYQPFDEATFTADIDDRRDIGNGRIDPYAQGLNVVDGELWVTYESGSHKYDQQVDSPREYIQRIPLEQLDLDAAGLTPDDLDA
ncbi:MAG: hypothetical protein IPJ65_28460 [Archangiaceae bacterium]|nr:hypothetical protein [Archangiaceae bacterium]